MSSAASALSLVILSTFCFLAISPASAQTADPAAAGGDGRLGVELNKLEATPEGNCRAYFLFRNGTGNSFDAFEMSLAILNANGVIDRLLTIDAAPIPVARTTLKLFEIPQMACTDISAVLLHDLAACRQQNAEPMDCFPLLTLGSKAAAPLEQ